MKRCTVINKCGRVSYIYLKQCRHRLGLNSLRMKQLVSSTMKVSLSCLKATMTNINISDLLAVYTDFQLLSSSYINSEFSI